MVKGVLNAMDEQWVSKVIVQRGCLAITTPSYSCACHFFASAIFAHEGAIYDRVALVSVAARATILQQRCQAVSDLRSDTAATRKGRPFTLSYLRTAEWRMLLRT